MPRPRLLAIITALIFIGGGSGAKATYTLAQLQEIERFIQQKDVASLRRYLLVNPEIMTGNDALSRELHGFFECAQSGRLDCFTPNGVPPAPKPVPANIPILPY